MENQNLSLEKTGIAGNNFYKRIDLSGEKWLGAIGTTIMLIGSILFFIPALAVSLWAAGSILLIMCMYRLGGLTNNRTIFIKFIKGFILYLSCWLIAIIFGSLSFAIAQQFYGKDVGAIVAVTVAMIIGYILFVISSDFFKQSYQALASTLNHSSFKTAGSLVYIGAITTIIFGLGLILIFIGWIALVAAFFTMPTSVDIASNIAT